MKENMLVLKNALKRKQPFDLLVDGVLVVLLIQLLAYLAYAFQIAAYPYDVNGGEGLVFQSAYALAQGVRVFTPLDQEPYFVMNYPGLYVFLLSLLIRLFGPQLIWGRLLSIGAALLSAYAVGRFVYRRSENKRAALFAGLLFTCSGWVHIWSVLVRVDMLAVMFSVWGLVFFLEGDCQKSMKKIGLAAVFFVAALFSRQSSIAAPCSCLALLACRQQNWFSAPVSRKGAEWKSMMILLSVMSGLGALLVAVMLIKTNGQFAAHITRYTLSAFQWGRYFDWLRRFSTAHGIVLALSVGMMLYHGLKRTVRLETLFFVLAAAVTLTAGKDGSSLNYFLEMWAAVCLVTGCVLAQAFKLEQQRLRNRLMRSALVLGLIAQVCLLVWQVDRTVPNEQDKKAGREISERVAAVQGKVLLEYAGYAAINGKLTMYSPFAMTELSDRGYWDQTLLIRDIAAQRFDLIILTDIGIHFQSWTADIVQAVRSHYDLVEQKECFGLPTDRQMATLFYVYQKKAGPEN